MNVNGPNTMDDAKPPPNADDELEPQDAGHGEEPDRLGDLLDEIVDPQFEVFARLIRNEALGKQPSDTASPTAQIDREVLVAERTIANLTDALSKIGFSEAIATKLKEEEARLVMLSGDGLPKARVESG